MVGRSPPLSLRSGSMRWDRESVESLRGLWSRPVTCRCLTDYIALFSKEIAAEGHHPSLRRAPPASAGFEFDVNRRWRFIWGGGSAVTIMAAGRQAWRDWGLTGASDGAFSAAQARASAKELGYLTVVF